MLYVYLFLHIVERVIKTFVPGMYHLFDFSGEEVSVHCFFHWHTYLIFHLFIMSEVFMQNSFFWVFLPCNLVAVYHCGFPGDSNVYSYCCENVRSHTELFTVDVLPHWSKELDFSCWVQGLACVMNGQDIFRKTAPGIALWYRLCGS